MRRIFALILLLAMLFASAGLGDNAPRWDPARMANGQPGWAEELGGMIAFIAHAHAADYDYPPEAEDMPRMAAPLPPPMAFRPAGSPPGYVLYAPVYVPPSRCLPGFFWRVYPDGNGECWPWAQ